MGRCPEREQESAPPQSPVAHLPLLPLKEQPVRPHTLPELVPEGTPKVHVSPGLSCLPPPAGVAAGHTVKPQLFRTVKVAAPAPAAAEAARSRRRTEEAAIDQECVVDGLLGGVARWFVE
jgi:hypothetical protein